MKTAPTAFLDSVAELLDRETLENLADSHLNCLWSQIADVHKRQRKYCRLHLWDTTEGVCCAFRVSQMLPEYMDIRDVQKIESRFLRILGTNDCSPREELEKQKVLKFGRDEFPQFEKFIHRHLPWKSVDCCSWMPNVQKFLLRALPGKIYFRKIIVAKMCPLAEDFVKDQMENGTFLKVVVFRGEWKWGSMLPHVKKFCFRPGRKRGVYGNFTLDGEFYQDLLDF